MKTFVTLEGGEHELRSPGATGPEPLRSSPPTPPAPDLAAMAAVPALSRPDPSEPGKLRHRTFLERETPRVTGEPGQV